MIACFTDCERPLSLQCLMAPFIGKHFAGAPFQALDLQTGRNGKNALEWTAQTDGRSRCRRSYPANGQKRVVEVQKTSTPRLVGVGIQGRREICHWQRVGYSIQISAEKFSLRKVLAPKAALLSSHFSASAVHAAVKTPLSSFAGCSN